MFISIQLIFKSKIIEVDKYIDNRRIITIFKKPVPIMTLNTVLGNYHFFKLKDTCL
jgi:hypothetical protein